MVIKKNACCPIFGINVDTIIFNLSLTGKILDQLIIDLD
jgi:hypothetical protein